MRSLQDLTWPDVPTSGTVLVAVGSLEQHGPHLPLNTDTVIAEAVAEAVARASDSRDVSLAPPISYGSSGEHQSFAGTSSIGNEVLHALLVELVRSMRTWATRVVFINGHGGNVCTLDAAVRQLVGEGHNVAWVGCVTDGDLHAGRDETSLMLHLRPDSVRAKRAVAGNPATLDELLPAMRSAGVAAVSPNGVLGDPAGASPEHGAQMLQAMTANALAAIEPP